MSMWRPWGKSSPTKTDQFSPLSSSPSTSSSIFRCSSFKDIETLCLNPDQQQQQQQQPPRTPRHSIFHRVRTANTLLRHWRPNSNSNSNSKDEDSDPSGGVVVYYTSLHVVRSTYEACWAVLSILHRFRVALDERDVAMDPTFMSELRSRLRSSEKMVSLPRVFIGSRYVGGAEEVLRLNENGELKMMLRGVPPASADTCGMCGGYRFVLCPECNGSHKIFSHKLGALRTCAACNHNGLVRCPRCCCSNTNRPILHHPNAS